MLQTCKERTPAPNKHHGPQSTSSGTNQSNGAVSNGQNLFTNQSHFKMHMTGMEHINLPNKCKLVMTNRQSLNLTQTMPQLSFKRLKHNGLANAPWL